MDYKTDLAGTNIVWVFYFWIFCQFCITNQIFETWSFKNRLRLFGYPGLIATLVFFKCFWLFRKPTNTPVHIGSPTYESFASIMIATIPIMHNRNAIMMVKMPKNLTPGILRALPFGSGTWDVVVAWNAGCVCCGIPGVYWVAGWPFDILQC